MKKRLRQYSKFNNPVSSLSFNCDGTRLAIGIGYMWDQGAEGLKGPVAGVAGETKTAERVMPEVGIRKLGDEIKVREFLWFLVLAWPSSDWSLHSQPKNWVPGST